MKGHEKNIAIFHKKSPTFSDIAKSEICKKKNSFLKL